MFHNDIPFKVAVGYGVVAIVLILAISLIYSNTKSVVAINQASREYMQKRDAADSTISALLKEEQHNLQQLSDAMNGNGGTNYLRDKVRSLNNGEESIVVHPKMRQTQQAKNTTVEVVKTRKGFFNRLSDAFKKEHAETISVKTDSIHATLDSVTTPVNVAGNVADILEQIDNKEKVTSAHHHKTVNKEMADLQMLNTKLALRSSKQLNEIHQREHKTMQHAIYNNIVSRKYYITGGVGARHEGEAFGADYELPNLTAYNETCAAIAMVYLFHRMFLMQGDAKYIDCMERTLYNGVISGMSVDGGRFFYPNPLSSDGTTERQPWFGCACCPSNICRFIPSFPGYVYAVKDRTLYVNLFTGNTAHVEIEGKTVVLEQQTDYPWNGDINLRIQKNQAKAFAMAIRIPGWAVNTPVPSDLYRYTDCQTRNYQITVNGKPIDGVKTDKGYLIINRVWKKGDVVSLHLDMPVRTVVANPQVTDDRGRVAVERGPLVYCAEAADNSSHNIFRFLMPTNPQFNVVDRTINGQHQVSFGVKAIEVDGQSVDTDADGRVKVSDTRLTLIPYYAWNHRGANDMEVWLPQSIEALGNYR